MKLIESDALLIAENNPIKKIELIGRTCYKSEDKITEDSCNKFLNSLISRSHYAMLEHVNLTFEITGISDIELDILYLPYVRYTHSGDVKYVTVSLAHLVKWSKFMYVLDAVSNYIFECMYRCFESKYGRISSEFDIQAWSCICKNAQKIQVRLISDEDKFIMLSEANKDIHMFATIKFICDRGVSHELVRHRCAVAQSSTRYCNYSNGKFGHAITYIKPSNYDNWQQEQKDAFICTLSIAEDIYMKMVEELHMQPQQARAVLPNALKTEVILTMPRWQWKHFINLRSKGTTGQPHPDMKIVADKAYDILKDTNFI